MSIPPVKRKLAAILAADAVGYSRLMAADEEGTMRVLAAHRAMIDGIIEFQEGRIVNTAGDSVLAEFESPVQAVRCAVEIQDALRTRNDSLPEDKRLVFRIGVNLGDVMVKGDDLLGDGVNVAARLESVADPGGICVSSSVYDQIAGKLDLGFIDVGHKALKNIDRPVRVYRIDRDGNSGTRKPRRLSPGLGWAAALAVLAAIGYGTWQWILVPIKEEQKRAQHATVARITEETRLRREAAERERLEAERQQKEREAVLARQIEAAEAAQRRAEQQANAAAEARRALEAQRAADERSRAEAEAARLRREAEDARRKAVEELAAAEAARRSAEKIAASKTALASVAAAVAPSLRAGVWMSEINCPSFQGFPPRLIAAPVTVSGDAFLIDELEPGQPGSLSLRGSLTADGGVVFRGSGITGMRGGAREYRAMFSAKAAGAGYAGNGRLGGRECSITLTRK